MNLVFEFIQTACVLITISYVLSRANFFAQVKVTHTLRGGWLWFMAAVFLFVAMYGTICQYILPYDTQGDTRIAGIALAGLLFGYLPSLLVLIPTLLLSVPLGLQMFPGDALAMTLAFFVSGYCHNHFSDYDAVLSGIIVGALEICHMLLIALFVHPLTLAKETIYAISFPMIVVNGLAVIAFVLIITDLNERRQLWQEESVNQSQKEAAKNIQSAMLETEFDIDPRLDLSATIIPAQAVGGDLYSFSVRKGCFLFIIGDVSGKGMPAALTMSRCTTLFQELVQHSDNPSQILMGLNHRLARNNNAMMFVTACVGALELSTGKLSYANAGHVIPYAVGGDNTFKKLPRPKGKPLGIFPVSIYENEETVLAPGEYFLSYTDGVTEAENRTGELYGSERLEALLAFCPVENASSLQKRILNAIDDHREEANQSDDITIFTFGLTLPAAKHEFTNDMEEFCAAAAQICEELKGKTSKGTADDISVILEEIVGNIIYYGYPEGVRGYIRITVWTGERAEILIEDDSRPFDPFTGRSPNIELAPADRPIGGMGIFLTKNRTKSHRYTSAAGENTLYIQVREDVHEK